MDIIQKEEFTGRINTILTQLKRELITRKIILRNLFRLQNGMIKEKIWMRTQESQITEGEAVIYIRGSRNKGWNCRKAVLKRCQMRFCRIKEGLELSDRQKQH